MKDPKELFEELRDRYDGIYERFSELRHSPLGIEHKEALGGFIHETNRLAGWVGYDLLKGTLPECDKSSMKWVRYNNLRTNVGIMELILKLSEK